MLRRSYQCTWQQPRASKASEQSTLALTERGHCWCASDSSWCKSVLVVPFFFFFCRCPLLFLVLSLLPFSLGALEDHLRVCPAVLSFPPFSVDLPPCSLVPSEELLARWILAYRSVRTCPIKRGLSAASRGTGISHLMKSQQSLVETSSNR